MTGSTPQLEDNGRRFHLRELALLSTVAPGIDGRVGLVETILSLRCRKEAEREWQERVPVRPAEDEQAEALRIAAAHMVVDVRQEFHALGTRAAEERIVDDDGTTPAGIRQRLDGFVDDPRRKKQRELAPVRVAGVQEAVSRVLVERQRILVKSALHIERAVLEDDAYEHEENENGGKSFELASVGRAQNLADMITTEERRSFLRDGFHLLGGL